MIKVFHKLLVDQHKVLKGTNILLDEPDVLLMFTLIYFQSNKNDRRKCLLSGVRQTLVCVMDLFGIQ